MVRRAKAFLGSQDAAGATEGSTRDPRRRARAVAISFNAVGASLAAGDVRNPRGPRAQTPSAIHASY